MVRLPGSSSLSVEIWLSRFDGSAGKWKRHSQDVALPEGSGQFVLADFDADGASWVADSEPGWSGFVRVPCVINAVVVKP